MWQRSRSSAAHRDGIGYQSGTADHRAHSLLNPKIIFLLFGIAKNLFCEREFFCLNAKNLSHT